MKEKQEEHSPKSKETKRSPYPHECVDRPHLICPACAWAEEQGIK